MADAVINTGLSIAVNVADDGNFQISYTASRLGVVGRYRVRLYKRRDGRLIREAFSDNTGNNLFAGIKNEPGGFFLIAHDHTSGDRRNAAIADLVTPEPMP